MKCPFCQNNETKVLDKRDSSSDTATRRRRECLNCKKRFTTYERPELGFIVIKKDGTKQEYNREKIKNGIIKACEKRGFSLEQINSFVSDIESILLSKNEPLVKSSVIGTEVLKLLKRVDKIAYLRFASVYKDFNDVESFKCELEKLQKKR